MQNANTPLNTILLQLIALNALPNKFLSGSNHALEDSLEALRVVKDWLGVKEQQDVEPLDPTNLPRNHFNTVQAALYKGE